MTQHRSASRTDKGRKPRRIVLELEYIEEEFTYVVEEDIRADPGYELGDEDDEEDGEQKRHDGRGRHASHRSDDLVRSSSALFTTEANIFEFLGIFL